MTRVLSLIVLAMALTAMAGCADSGGADGATASFAAVDIDYEEAPAELPAGEITVELVNEGQLDHNVVFEELGDELVAEAGAGETATGTVELEPGEYTVYCSIPGHREAGMETTVTVE